MPCHWVLHRDNFRNVLFNLETCRTSECLVVDAKISLQKKNEKNTPTALSLGAVTGGRYMHLFIALSCIGNAMRKRQFERAGGRLQSSLSVK